MYLSVSKSIDSKSLSRSLNCSACDEQTSEHVVGHEHGHGRERGERRKVVAVGRSRLLLLLLLLPLLLRLLLSPFSSFPFSSLRAALFLGQGLRDLRGDQVLARRLLPLSDDVEEERLAGAEVRGKSGVAVAVVLSAASSAAGRDGGEATPAGIPYEEGDGSVLQE